MPWILPRSISSAFARDMGVLTLVSTEAWAAELEHSLAVNEKPMRSQTLLRKASKDAHLHTLSTRTCEPSLSRLLPTWIVSRYAEDFPVSPSVFRETAPSTTEKKTRDTCGQPSSGASVRQDPISSCLKTLTASQAPSSTEKRKQVFFSMSWPQWKAWATLQRRHRSAREKSVASRTTGGAGSSSEHWPTPSTAEDYGVAGTWKGFVARREKFKKKGVNLHKKLDVAVQDPRNLETTHGLQGPAKPNTSGSTQESLWPTPRANKMEGTTNEGYGDCLIEAVRGRKGWTPWKLSPLWVAMLMGLPADWAILPPSWEPRENS